MTTKINLETQVKGTKSPSYAADSGTTNAFAVTGIPLAPSLVTGSKIIFKAANANTGAATLTVNGGSPIAIKRNVSTALVAGDILANQIVEVVYDGTNFQLQTPSSDTTQPFDVAVFFPGAQTSASQVFSRFIPARAVNFPAGLSPSTATAITAATGSTVISLEKNGSQFGTITFAGAGTSGTFAAASPASFNGTSDVLAIIGPASADATLADIGIVLSGTR
jgi:hypothetical protein